MKIDDVLSFSDAARKKGCSRTTLYRAARDGRLNAVDVGGRRMIVRDAAWDAFEPKLKGGRVRKLEREEGSAPRPSRREAGRKAQHTTASDPAAKAPHGDLPGNMASDMRRALAEAKRRLQGIYGDRLRRVVLYGSRARGEATPESDVDLLVVLRGPIENHYQELKHMGDLRSALMERYGLYFSFHPCAESDFQDMRRPFIQNVRSEGVAL